MCVILTLVDRDWTASLVSRLNEWRSIQRVLASSEANGSNLYDLLGDKENKDFSSDSLLRLNRKKNGF